jgi:hypothetical protein
MGKEGRRVGCWRRVIPFVDQPTITPSHVLAEFEMDLATDGMKWSEIIAGYIISPLPGKPVECPIMFADYSVLPVCTAIRYLVAGDGQNNSMPCGH